MISNIYEAKTPVRIKTFEKEEGSKSEGSSKQYNYRRQGLMVLGGVGRGVTLHIPF